MRQGPSKGEGCARFKRIKRAVYTELVFIVLAMMAGSIATWSSNPVTSTAGWIMWLISLAYLFLGFNAGAALDHYDDCVECQPIKAAVRRDNPNQEPPR